jgi:hypothetical protein
MILQNYKLHLSNSNENLTCIFCYTFSHTTKKDEKLMSCLNSYIKVISDKRVENSKLSRENILQHDQIRTLTKVRFSKFTVILSDISRIKSAYLNLNESWILEYACFIYYRRRRN